MPTVWTKAELEERQAKAVWLSASGHPPARVAQRREGEPMNREYFDAYVAEHGHAPWLMCGIEAECLLDDDVEHIQTAEGCVISLNGQGHLPCSIHGRFRSE